MSVVMLTLFYLNQFQADGVTADHVEYMNVDSDLQAISTHVRMVMRKIDVAVRRIVNVVSDVNILCQKVTSSCTYM